MCLATAVIAGPCSDGCAVGFCLRCPYGKTQEATASHLALTIRPLGISISRLASDLPVGGDLEYADELTLGRPIEASRTP